MKDRRNLFAEQAAAYLRAAYEAKDPALIAAAINDAQQVVRLLDNALQRANRKAWEGGTGALGVLDSVDLLDARGRSR
jgi:2-methylisocitrate lyase-like PEP mutase family enzyme